MRRPFGYLHSQTVAHPADVVAQRTVGFEHGVHCLEHVGGGGSRLGGLQAGFGGFPHRPVGVFGALVGVIEGVVSVEVAEVAVNHRTGVEDQHVARLDDPIGRLTDDVVHPAWAGCSHQIRDVIGALGQDFASESGEGLPLGHAD